VHYPIIDLVDGWFFRTQEISYGAFKVDGIDRWGRIVSREGSDNELEKILLACADDARETNKGLGEAGSARPCRTILLFL
jgi:hypothetical protein